MLPPAAVTERQVEAATYITPELSQPRVAILLPTYNERETIEPFLRQVLAAGPELRGYDLRVVVIDSHSPDGTAEAVRELMPQEPRLHLLEVQRGLGVALREAYGYAVEQLQADVLVQIDADGQSGVEVLPRLLAGIDEGFDLVVGSRFVPGGRNELELRRRTLTMGSSLLMRWLAGSRSAREVTNLARAFRPALLRRMRLDRIPWEEPTFVFLPAFLHEAMEAGASIKEVPLVFKHRAEGYSKNRVLAYSYDLAVYCLEARLRKWRVHVRLFRARYRWRRAG